MGDEIESVFLRDYASGDGSDSRIVYPIDLLDGEDRCFTKTDTHYSSAGFLAIARCLAETCHPEVADAVGARLEAGMGDARPYSGDLGRACVPPRSETVPRFHPDPDIVQETNGVESGNDGLLLIQKNAAALTEKTLLIFGDSFFRLMLPYLAPLYRRIIFCRTRFFHDEILAATSPDIVFSGMAERYLSDCRPDGQRDHFLNIPLVLGKRTAPTPGFAALWQEATIRAQLI
ncbi:hypothetical protein [Jannaschia rubra]|uniref:hypothetical protein n=1 Tax=Jannaschia rubra TaxID=282197 RepID=UPI0024932D53|nr:hypothetical protein [Jannaschia rubra]